MTHLSLLRRSIAEFFAAALVMAVLIGSSLQAQSVSQDVGVVMLFVWLSLMCALMVTIFVFAPISGAHFNPVVSWVMVFKKNLSVGDALVYTIAQIAGAISGTLLANLMYAGPAIQFSNRVRSTPGELLGELISTAGLIALILVLGDRGLGKWSWAAVTGWIGSCFLFTASTCFANPAVTIARIFSGSGAGIAAESVLPFIAVQLVAGGLGIWIAKLLRVQTVKA